MPIQLSPDQATAISSKTQGETADFFKGYQEINYIISKNPGVLDAKTEFWYNQAEKINDPSSDDPSKKFIYNVTKNGFALDGNNDVDLQAVSDAIARKVLTDTVGSSTGDPRIGDIGSLIQSDIGVVLDGFGATIGGWGGSFYYWNEIRSDGNTVGYDIQHTSNDGYAKGEDAKFVATNGAAIAASVSTAYGFGAALRLAFAYPFGGSAELPYGEAAEVTARAVDLVVHGGPIVGDSDQIGAFTYTPGSPSNWSVVTSGLGFFTLPLLKVAPTDTATDLDAHRAWILDHNSVNYGASATQHADVIADPSQNIFEVVGSTTGEYNGNDAEGQALQTLSQSNGATLFDSSSYQSMYDLDNNLLATSKVFTSNGSPNVIISDSQYVTQSEQDLNGDNGATTVILKQVGLGSIGSNDVSVALRQFSEVDNSNASSDEWSSFTFSDGFNYSNVVPDVTHLSVQNKDGTSYFLTSFQPLPQEQQDAGVLPRQYEEDFFDAKGNLTEDYVHYSSSCQLYNGRNNDIQTAYGTDLLTLYDASTGDTTYQCFNGPSPDINHPQTSYIVTPTGFDATWASAQSIFEHYLPGQAMIVTNGSDTLWPSTGSPSQPPPPPPNGPMFLS